MTKTQNYNLNKPESTDPLRVAEFNENADIIDAALAKLAVGMPKIAAGSYTGDGGGGSTTAKTQAIEVGFYPKAVLVYPQDGIGYVNKSTYGYKEVCSAVATREADAKVNGLIALTLTETGFTVNLQRKTATLDGYTSENIPATNYGNKVFNYIAVG